MLLGTKRSRLTQRASIHLDMARGLAALAVLFGHVRGLFFVPYHELQHHSAALAAFYGLTTLGHQAVIVFFVLSGFFIVSSIVDSFEREHWSWTVYLANRIVRLSLVLIPALFLCCIVDHIGMAMRSTATFYYYPVENLFTTSVSDFETFRNFIGSFCYLQSIVVQPFGSDGPLWSLSYEFWYYILFPLALCALMKRVRPVVRIAYLLLVILVACFIGRIITMYFLIWLLGGAIAGATVFSWSPFRLARVNAITVVPLICVLGLSVARPLNSGFLTDLIVALGFTLWVYATVEAPERPISVLYVKSARLFAGFSYTLYLTHFPLVFLMRAGIIHGKVWRPDAIHLLYALGIATVPIVIAYGIAQVTEAKTAQVRRKVLALCHTTVPKAISKN